MATLDVPLAHILPSDDGKTVDPGDLAWFATLVGTDLAKSNDDRLFPPQGDGLVTTILEFLDDEDLEGVCPDEMVVTLLSVGTDGFATLEIEQPEIED